MRYAIGDCHGCIKTFQAVLDRIDLQPYDQLFLLGDYVDRGPNSKQVIDVIISLIEQGLNVVPLKGNHEDMMLQARGDRGIFQIWMQNGGRDALNSYDKNWNTDNWVSVVPHEHWKFLESLPQLVVIGDYIFSHASLNWYAEDPLAETGTDAFIWERDNYFHPDRIGGRSLINGHTPTPRNEIEVEVSCLKTAPNRIIIDNGCFFKHKGLDSYISQGYGSLCCLNLDTKDLIFQENID